MGFINLAEKTIGAKLVYYGVGMGGKTTTLQAVHAIMCPRNEVQLVSIKTEEDSTLLFDFLPINLGQVEGFKIRIQGFTVPGQPKYKVMRKYVLSGADAVVFVVDSQRSRLEENLQSLESLMTNLRLNGLDPDTLPIVLQYNKRDLDDILSEKELDQHFKFRTDLMSFPSVATEGQGVFEAFVQAAGMLVESRVRLSGLGQGEVNPIEVAKAAVAKLWEVHDYVRGRGPDAKERPALSLTIPEAGRTARGVPEDAETMASRGGAILSDADLDVALGLDSIEEPGQPLSDEERSLLDRTIRANVELAERYGDLDQYRVLVERKNKELVRVAQDAVHDLKRPLAAVKLFIASMAKGYLGELADPLRAGVDNSLHAVRMLERLINDLLDSSRLDFDGVKMCFNEVDMALLLADVLCTLRNEILARDVRITVEPLPVVVGDEWALTKVFLNLVGNAIQYAHPDRNGRVNVSARDELDRWVIVVEDNGIGIPQHDMKRLFHRFERGSNTKGVSGTGLGLHIVREVVMGHGGTVWVDSTEGNGCTFHVALPHHPVQPEHSAVSDVAEQADL